MDNLVRAFEAAYDNGWLPADMLEHYSPVECLAENNNCVTLLLQSREGDQKLIAKCYSRDNVRIAASENDILSSISHDSLPEYVGSYENERMICVVRKYAEGQTLRAVLEEKRFTAKETAAFALKLCDVLGFLHRLPSPVLHRDIKPENIIIDGEKVYLIDFGISRILTDPDKKDTRIAATASYAPPEQFGFLPTDERSDIYALGVVMNEMITGSTDTRQDAPDGGFGRIIRKCTAFSPEDRYRSVARLERDIQRWTHRHLRWAGAALLTLALLALTVTAAIWLAGYIADTSAAREQPEPEQLPPEEIAVDSVFEPARPVEPLELRITEEGFYLDDVLFAEDTFDPESVTSLVIDESAPDIKKIDFSVFTNLEEVTLPGTVPDTVCSSAILKTHKLSSITVGHHPETGIGWKYDFLTDTLEVFGDGIGTGIIENNLYWNNVAGIDTSAIESIVVGEGVRELGFNVFWDYSFVESFSLPASLEILDSSNFADNRSLKTVTFSAENPRFSIVDGALYGSGNSGSNPNYKLYFVPRDRTGTFVVQPGTAVIGKFSFEDCQSIEEIVLPESLSSIDGSAFVNARSLKRFAVPENSVFSFDEESGLLTTVRTRLDNRGFSFTEAHIILALSSYTGHYTTPGEYDCVLMTDGAFEGCKGLTEVTITDNVLEIGAEVFADCSSLKKVNMPEDITALTRRFAYQNKSFFNHATFKDSSIESLKIPYGVTSITEWCFHNCQDLKEIFIPDTVTDIDSTAFDGCTGYKTLYYTN